MLSVYGTSRLVTNTNRWARLAAMRLRKLASRLADRDRRHDPIEPAIQIGMNIAGQRCVFQRLPPSSDGDRAQ